MTIKYNGSVNTQAGWRSVKFTAKVKKISEKRCEIIEVIHIDDEPISTNMSRTGSKRQKYNGEYFSQAQTGKKKNLSGCEIL